MRQRVELALVPVEGLAVEIVKADVGDVPLESPGFHARQGVHQDTGQFDLVTLADLVEEDEPVGPVLARDRTQVRTGPVDALDLPARHHPGLLRRTVGTYAEHPAFIAARQHDNAVGRPLGARVIRGQTLAAGGAEGLGVIVAEHLDQLLQPGVKVELRRLRHGLGATGRGLGGEVRSVEVAAVEQPFDIANCLVVDARVQGRASGRTVGDLNRRRQAPRTLVRDGLAGGQRQGGGDKARTQPAQGRRRDHGLRALGS